MQQKITEKQNRYNIGIQYTFVSTLAESKFRSHEFWLLRQGARNAAATEHSDVCQPGVHKY